MNRLGRALNLENWCLVGIVGLGAVLRLWGIHYGLPYTLAPDEPTYLTITLQILRTGDLNPHWWYYPSAMFYLHALAQLIFFVLGRASGMFTTLADLPLPEIITTGVGKVALPETLLIARGVTGVFSTLAILVVYAIGRRLHTNTWVAMLAALLYALSPTVNDTSHRVGPDVFAMFFLLVSVFFAVRLVDDPRWQNYVGAGLGAGLAFGSKYNAGVVLIACLVAHFLRWRWTQWQKLGWAFGAFALGFFLSTPFALFDFANFWAGLQWQVFSYAVEGHSGQEGDSLRWYLTYLWEVERDITLLGAFGIVWMTRTFSSKYLTVLSFPIAYFALVSQMLTRNERTIMLIVPFLALGAATLCVELYQRWGTASKWRRVLALGVLGVVVLPSLRTSLAASERLLTVDSRETARVWIEQNLPRGSRIAIEPYSPYVDRDYFVVEPVSGVIAHPIEWYIQNGFEYLITSYGTYGRFYEDRARYRELATRYDEFFAQVPEVRRFNDGGFEVRILKTNAADLPRQRVGARWGVYGDWLELVGYDQAVAVLPGEPLRVTLYWRMLTPRREVYQLTARLLDRNDHEIAQSSGELRLASESITRVAWSIAVPPAVAPGRYRIQLEVDAPSVGRVPVLNRFREPIADKVFIEPFKVAPIPPTQTELNTARHVEARLGDAIVLLGYTLSYPSPADTLNLTLYWQSIARVEKDYTVFVHLVDSNGNLRAQRDAPPLGGAYPTLIWEVGEIVRDEYALALGNLPRGEYQIRIGMYEYPSLERLRVKDGKGNEMGDHLVLESVQVLR